MSEAVQNHYNDDSDEWDIDISPRQALFHLNLAEIWRYRDLVMLMVKRDFVAKYKQTILGPFWHVLQPALTTLMSYLLFNVVANLSTDGKNAILFQLSGITIWNYFSACITSTSSTFITNASIFGKVYFPRLVMPIAIVISNLLQMAIQFALLLGTVLFFVVFLDTDIPLSPNLFLLPLVVILIAGTALGMGIIISSLTTKYRDLTVLVTFGVQLLMFGSAVNYPLAQLESSTHSGSFLFLLVKWNPISTLVETFRNALLGGEIHYAMLGYTFVVMIVTLLVGMMMFQKVEKSFMDTV